MKNEHKIDPIPMHNDRDLVQRKIENKRGPLERGPRPFERGLLAVDKFGF